MAIDLAFSRNALLFGALFLLFFGLVQIRMSQAVVLRWWRQANAADRRKPDTKQAAPKAEAAKVEALKKQRQDQRMLLHLLTLLQREGRLMDFLGENLSAYDDAQIGMAVRSIQENCKAAVEKQLRPKAVMDAEEESEVTVAAGFDPNTIKLVGNVSGEPPFSGILRHKGWRATRVEIPALADKDDPLVIAPAEVEIL
ncbi:MAG: DUF2760 domain-containing protein [Desulfosarcinaceae bacterium]